MLRMTSCFHTNVTCDQATPPKHDLNPNTLTQRTTQTQVVLCIEALVLVCVHETQTRAMLSAEGVQRKSEGERTAPSDRSPCLTVTQIERAIYSRHIYPLLQSVTTTKLCVCVCVLGGKERAAKEKAGVFEMTTALCDSPTLPKKIGQLGTLEPTPGETPAGPDYSYIGKHFIMHLHTHKENTPVYELLSVHQQKKTSQHPQAQSAS